MEMNMQFKKSVKIIIIIYIRISRPQLQDFFLAAHHPKTSE